MNRCQAVSACSASTIFTTRWSAAAADVNHDGILDIIAGPFYYLGPDYTGLARDLSQPDLRLWVRNTRRRRSTSPTTTPAMAGRTCLVATGRPMSLYVNPKGELRRWDKYNVLPTINSRDCSLQRHRRRRQARRCVCGRRHGQLGRSAIRPIRPTPWIVHPVSEPGYGVVAQHGIGAGDINGDGRVDIVSPYGWWEQPPKGTPDGTVALSSGEVRVAGRGRVGAPAARRWASTTSTATA